MNLRRVISGSIFVMVAIAGATVTILAVQHGLGVFIFLGIVLLVLGIAGSFYIARMERHPH